MFDNKMLYLFLIITLVIVVYLHVSVYLAKIICCFVLYYKKKKKKKTTDKRRGDQCGSLVRIKGIKTMHKCVTM